MSGSEPAAAGLHQDRIRALSFGAGATLYDRARPSYPKELIDDLMELQPHTVLDVGCGTGKAGRLLLERGCDVVGVEPDGRMAAVARSHGLTVEEATFETWDPRGRSFDLLVSGQAWHWVEPSAGAAKAAAVLVLGGHLGAFWNIGSHEPEALAQLEPVYARLAPEIAGDTTALWGHPRAEAWRLDALLACGQFSPVELRTYQWVAEYSREQWLEFIATHSDHAGLEASRRASLFDAVAEAIDRLGGVVRFAYQTVLILARRADGDGGSAVPSDGDGN